MSTDFSNQLTTLLDDVAGGISPRADFAAAQAGAAEMTLAPATAGGKGPFRGLAAVAALILLIAGGVLAYQRTTGDPDSLSTATEVDEPIEPVTEPKTPADGESPDDTSTAEADTDTPLPKGDSAVASSGVSDTVPSKPAAYTPDDGVVAEVHEVDFAAEPPVVVVRGEAPDGEQVDVYSLAGAAETTADGGVWSVELLLTNLANVPGDKLLIIVSAGDSKPEQLWLELPARDEPKDEPVEEPKEEPKAEEPKDPPPPPKEDPKPVVVAFTAAVDDTHFDNEPPKVHLAGRAQPGTKVHVAHQYGEQYVKASDGGYWEIWYKLWEIAPGRQANLRVTNQVSESVYEFAVVVPEADPVQVAFTAHSVEGDHTGNPMWHRFSGTAQPGSGVLASSPYGVEDVAVGENGEWTLKLWMEGVPAGTGFKVHVTNTVSGEVFKFWIEKPAEEPEPEPVAFTANAVYGTCSEDPPYDVYWGTAQPGSVVKITSPYGFAEFTVGESGEYEKTVFFPEAPIGETFTVKVKSHATGEFQEFPFTRLGTE